MPPGSLYFSYHFMHSQIVSVISKQSPHLLVYFMLIEVSKVGREILQKTPILVTCTDLTQIKLTAGMRHSTHFRVFSMISDNGGKTACIEEKVVFALPFSIEIRSIHFHSLW